METVLKRTHIDISEYHNALKRCSLLAHEEYKNLNEKLYEVRDILNECKANIDSFVKEYNDLLSNDDEGKLFDIINQLKQDVNSHLDTGLIEIEKSCRKKRNNLDKFTIALFGRTKAGKSTIREALTNGNGETIGKGAQRTTRDIKEYEWNKLRIIDTPGISAYKGDEDVEIARSIIDEADLILFLVTNDGIQESEFSQLAELRAQNKPVIIVLNVKIDIENKIRLKKFLCDSKKILDINQEAG